MPFLALARSVLRPLATIRHFLNPDGVPGTGHTAANKTTMVSCLQALMEGRELCAHTYPCAVTVGDRGADFIWGLERLP